MFAFGGGILAVIVAALLAGTGEPLSLFGVWLGVWLIGGALSDVANRVRAGAVPAAESLRRLVGLPRSALGTAFAHAGVGITVLGIVVATTWSTEAILSMKPGSTATLSGYDLTLDGYVNRQAGDFNELAARFSVRRGGVVVAEMEPSKRRFATHETTTTEAALHTFGFSQLYVSLGDIAADGTATVRIFWKPVVTLIWLGAIVTALGGLLSLSDRRHRVGAPKPARRPEAVPAE
jgi:cytochrome c-type biogenesis protein CcmF